MIETGYWDSSALGVGVITVRLIVAALLAAVLGIEREARDRDAGLKTHMLTALAAATFTVITIELFADVKSSNGANADPIRIIEAVTAGIAFIAAGAIIRNEDKVRGLTTGAGMWLAGAIGVACGAGFLALAGIATFIGFIVLTVIRWIEHQTFSDDG